MYQWFLHSFVVGRMGRQCCSQQIEVEWIIWAEGNLGGRWAVVTYVWVCVFMCFSEQREKGKQTWENFGKIWPLPQVKGMKETMSGDQQAKVGRVENRGMLDWLRMANTYFMDVYVETYLLMAHKNSSHINIHRQGGMRGRWKILQRLKGWCGMHFMQLQIQKVHLVMCSPPPQSNSNIHNEYNGSTTD